MRGFDLFRGDALNAYRDWPAPATIVSDGAYGVRGFHGDTIGTEALPRWYRPHIAAWAAAADPATTLWFWNTELGWASVHPVLAEFGWEYVQLIVWDKGLAHIAGPDGPMPPKQWVRHEWARSGLSLQRANEACGDVVWEPFGGLCSASVAAVAQGRRACAAETDPAFADLAIERLRRSGTAARVPAAAMVAR